jgi:hypothetical protein
MCEQSTMGRSVGIWERITTRRSGPRLATASGIVVGSSRRYEGGATLLGQSAWVAPESGGTQRVGLVGAEFRRADGQIKP